MSKKRNKRNTEIVETESIAVIDGVDSVVDGVSEEMVPVVEDPEPIEEGPVEVEDTPVDVYKKVFPDPIEEGDTVAVNGLQLRFKEIEEDVPEGCNEDGCPIIFDEPEPEPVKEEVKEAAPAPAPKKAPAKPLVTKGKWRLILAKNPSPLRIATIDKKIKPLNFEYQIIKRGNDDLYVSRIYTSKDDAIADRRMLTKAGIATILKGVEK